ncbi:MAG: hypothetical protein AAGI91_00125 [Bacteroidota bacterium]
MTRFLLPVLFATLLAAPVTAAADARGADERVTVPEGGQRGLTVADLRPHRATGNTYNEAWAYAFALDGGMQATFSLTRANLGSLMSSVSGAEFSISGFGGRTYRAAKQYDAEDLVFSEGAHRLQVHPNIYFEGALPQRHRAYFKASKNGVQYEVDLAFSDIAAGLTWGDGVFRLGDEQIGMFLHIPYARVSGTVTIDGRTERVSGTATMDHTFQTDFAPKLVRAAYRYVQHGRDAEVGYFVLPASRFEDRVVGFAAVREGGRFRLRRPDTVREVSTRRMEGVEIPQQLAVGFAGGSQTILNRERDHQVFGAFDELSGLQRTLAKRYVGGEVVVVRGRGTTNRRGRIVYDYLVVK